MDLTENNQELALIAYRGFHDNFISGMMDLQLMMESFSSSINNVNIQLMEEDLISTENQEFEGKSSELRIVEPCYMRVSEPCRVADEHMELMDVEEVLMEWAMYEKLQWNSAGVDQAEA